MNAIKFLRAALILVGILLSACAAPSNSAAANVGGDKALSEVAFTGVIESMDRDLWVINGQPVRVDSSVLRDGSFVVGDTVAVEASVAQDGSVTAQRVESPAAATTVELSTSTPGVSSAAQGPVFDDNGTEAVGTVDAITDTSVTIGGQTFTFASGVEMKDQIQPGDVVKLHFAVNADGSLSVREIELADPAQIGDANGNDDNSNDTNVNDNSNVNDNGNTNDHDGNDDNSNDDDHGGNSNDDDDNNSNDSNNNG